MPTAEVFAWNPRKALLRGRLSRFTQLGPRVNNFGDLIGPHIVAQVLARKGIVRSAGPHRRLLSVGSVLHFAKDGDVVWGSGRNGKAPADWHHFRDLDVRAVRGPLTRKFLLGRGIDVPEVYGDPALLLAQLRPDLVALADNEQKQHQVTIVPNLNDADSYPQDEKLLHPRSPLESCLTRIATSRLVIASSLHGIIVAEALGVPVRALLSRAEPQFKYEDYYAGTGRPMPRSATSLDEALELGGDEPLSKRWDPSQLLEAFPTDLWLPPVAVSRTVRR